MIVDFGKTASDYSTHRAGFPEKFFYRIWQMNLGKPNDTLLDLGTGTGTLARGFAKQGYRVTGSDLSAPLLQEASALAQKEQLSIDWLEARAEETQLPSSSFQIISAGQCWHWFDRRRAAAEVHRMLKPGGSLVIAHFDWLSYPGNVVERSIEIAMHHRDTPPPAVVSVGLRSTYCLWLEEVEAAGLRDVELFSFDVDVPYTHDAWRGRMRASALGGGTMTPSQLAAFDKSLRDFLRALPDNKMHPSDSSILRVPHRVFALIAKKKGDIQ